jgi:hypothetical protein
MNYNVAYSSSTPPETIETPNSSSSSTPWNADYATSIRTQHRIQQAAVQAEANMWNNPNNDGSNNHHSNVVAVKQAICTILQTLHDTPPELCNAANIVCALTLSSKIWERSKKRDGGSSRRMASGSSYSSSSSSSSALSTTANDTTTGSSSSSSNSNNATNELYATLFTSTLTILSSLVSIPNQLSPRQLCNAAWSLAKFVLHDDDNTALTKRNVNIMKLPSGSSTTTTTLWDLRQGNNDDDNEKEGSTPALQPMATTTLASTAKATSRTISTTAPTLSSPRRVDNLIDEVFNLIALRVTEHLEEIQGNSMDDDGSTDNTAQSSAAPTRQQQLTTNNIIRPGEISMLLWAYAIVGPRDRPPGWESPRRLERLSSVVVASSSSSGDGEDENGRSIDADIMKTKKTGSVTATTTSAAAAATAAEKDADFVTFVELDSFSTSTDDKKQYNLADDATGSSYPDGSNSSSNTVDRLFDAVAVAFCQGEGAARIVTTDKVEGKEEEDRLRLLSNCTWRELSNIAWSYATRGAYISNESKRVMSIFANEATSRIRSCILGSGSGSSTRNTNTAASIGARERNSCNFLPRDAIQIAWALGIMESDNVNSGDALVYLVDSIHDYWIDNDAVSSTTEGGASNQQQQPQRHRHRPLAQWTCADLVQLATAMAHGRLDNQRVLEAIYLESLERIRNDHGGGGYGGSQHPRHNRGFSTSEISILIWVQARLYLTPKFGDIYATFPTVASRELLRRMESNDDHQLQKRMRRIGLVPQEQANLAWSLTVLENYSSSVVSLLQNIFQSASSSLLSSSSLAGDADDRIIQLEHAHQLWQSYFLLNKDCPDATKFVPLEFRNYLEEKWRLEKSRNKSSSSRHRAISKTLNLMKVAHRNEYDEDVDVAIVLEENSAWTHTAQRNFDGLAEEGHRKVAVEFDGPHHFTRPASTEKDLSLIEGGAKITPRVLGHTVLKYRLLKRKGWTVIRIPYYEFDKIPFWASMVSLST